MATDTIKGRVELGTDGMTRVRLLIKHPMLIESRDAKTGEVKPPHCIEELTCTFKDKVVMSMDVGQAISANPFIEFFFKGGAKGDKLTIAWKDNKGDTDKADMTVA